VEDDRFALRARPHVELDRARTLEPSAVEGG
jgi:hypothetical protein